MSRKKIFISVLILVTVLALGIIVRDAFITPFRGGLPVQTGSGVIGLIYVEGPIVGGRSQSGFLTVSRGTDLILSQLREARLDPLTRAVVVRVNSPGGSAAASQEINSEIKKLREEGKVVVVSMADVAASGGYYIAAAADKILANPGTTTGSIGVIMQVTNLEELYEKIGMEIETIKSGEQKDIGNPARPMTEEERSILQSISNDIYDQFVDAVAEGRNLSRERVLELADGRIFTGRQAFELDLIDELGDLYDAVEKAAELAGLDQIVIKEYGKLSFWDVFLGGGVNHYDLHGNFMEELNLYRLIRGVEIK